MQNHATFKQFLEEALNAPVEYKVTMKTLDARRGRGRFTATFVSNGREITFEAEEEAKRTWSIAFWQKSEKSNYDISITGGGREFEVFATLKRIMDEFVRFAEPDEIVFTAEKDEPSRIKFYKRLFSRMPGWKVHHNTSQKHHDEFSVVRGG